MNTWKIAGIATIVVLAIAALGAGFVFAQTPTPQTPWGNGYGMMGGASGAGMMGGGYGAGMMNGVDVNAMHQWMSTTDGMHNIVWGGLAETLGLTQDELNAELASGKTLTQIAEAKGVSQDELAAALETSAKAGLDKAVTDGVLTQEQANGMLNTMGGNYGWMLSHMGSIGDAGFGPGGCHGNFAPRDNS